MSGWQCEEQYLLDQCSIVLNRVIERFPEGTLWVLNRKAPLSSALLRPSLIRSDITGAKLCRMRHDTASAISIIEAALEKGSSFREADSLLVFEVIIRPSPSSVCSRAVADSSDPPQLSWCYLSAAEWIKAAESFERMCTLNNWSHSTYLAISTGEPSSFTLEAVQAPS